MIICQRRCRSRWRKYVWEKKNDLLALAEFIPEWEETPKWRENLSTLPLAEWSENNQLMARLEHLLEKEGGPEDGCVWEDME